MCLIEKLIDQRYGGSNSRATWILNAAYIRQFAFCQKKKRKYAETLNCRMCAVQKKKKFDAGKFPHSATVVFSCFILLTSGMVDFVCFFGTAARQPHGGTVDLGCLKLRDGCNGCDDGCGTGVGCKFVHPIRHQTQQNENEMIRFDKNETE